MARTRERERLLRTEQLVVHALNAPLERSAEQILKEAVALIPGAQGGTLLLKEGARFRYAAALGYDLEALTGRSIEEALLSRWYGADLHLQKPRLRTQEEIPWQALAEGLGEPHLPEASRLRATLGLPVAFKGEVLAFLNVENFEDEQAFDEESLYVAEAFAAPIAALVHALEHRRVLEDAAYQDPLTGLQNRRAFNAKFTEELRRALRYGTPLSLAVLDMQGFKAVNDRYGHEAGDRALIEVAKALAANLRATDQAYRWGGDEFAVLLPETNAKEARRALERIAEAIRLGSSHNLGANIGLATFPEDGNTAEALLCVADRRMYQAKAQRRAFSD
jgi:diguanylate cyclase (GGDEF)-like protein